MRFDFSQVDEVESFVSVPKGTYTCRVAEVREGRSRDGSVRWSLRLEVVDPGEFEGRTAAWDSLVWSERGVYRIKKILTAMDFDTSKELELESHDLIGMKVQVQVEPEEQEDALTGRRMVRMRVPYLGYARVGSEFQAPSNAISPSAALELIHKELDGKDWDADTLDNIAHIVERTGRKVRPPEDA